MTVIPRHIVNTVGRRDYQGASCYKDGGIVRSVQNKNVQNWKEISNRRCIKHRFLKQQNVMAMGISIALIPASLATNIWTASVDRRLITANGYVRIKVVDAEVFVLPLICLPLLNPVVAAASGDTNSNNYWEAPGGGQTASLYRLPVPITIGANRNFSVVLTYDGTTTLTTSHDMYFFFHTFMRRPGQ